MTVEYRYAGPDGERIPELPEGTGAALGSDYCVHLLPGPDSLARAVEEAGRRDVPLLLLLPYFRDAELARAVALLRAVPAGADLTVSVNDWGGLFAFRTLFPSLRLTVGRLLSGQKRCPRIGGSARLTEEGREWHGEGIHSSPSVLRNLREEYGVAGLHLDALEWSRLPVPSGGEDPAEGMLLYLHGPFAAVTVSDRCPWIGGASSAGIVSCPRNCRDGAVALREPSMGEELLQRGKARFVRTGFPRAGSDAGRNPGVRFVRYDDLP